MKNINQIIDLILISLTMLLVGYSIGKSHQLSYLLIFMGIITIMGLSSLILIKIIEAKRNEKF